MRTDGDVEVKSGSRLTESRNGLWLCVNIYRKILGVRRQFEMSLHRRGLFTLELSRGFPSDGAFTAAGYFCCICSAQR